MLKLIFWGSIFCVLHTFILYPLTLKVIGLFYKEKDNEIFVEKKATLIVVAHNEEKVIKKKLENLMELKYKPENLEIIISSDGSTDLTNKIVKDFINKEKNKFNVFLYEVKERKGKTNAQNEAVKVAKGEIIVMTDANALLEKNSVRELVKTLNDSEVGYVSGQLKYVNSYESITSSSENTYWSYDLSMREEESKISSITAGNGALYAVRRDEYIDIDPIYSHDSKFPILMAINKKKAKYNKNAVAFEKAGEVSGDEFKRKVRMARKNLKITFSNLQKYNPFMVGWFSYFYISHRGIRNLLWIFHIGIFLTNICLLKQKIYLMIWILQVSFYLIASIGKIINIKIMHLPYYYSMTLVAQMKGAINEVIGKSKPIWEKAESTR